MYIFKKYLYFSSFEAGNCVSNSSFKWRKIQLKQFSRTRVRVKNVKYNWWLNLRWVYFCWLPCKDKQRLLFTFQVDIYFLLPLSCKVVFLTWDSYVRSGQRLTARHSSWYQREVKSINPPVPVWARSSEAVDYLNIFICQFISTVWVSMEKL